MSLFKILILVIFISMFGMIIYGQVIVHQGIPGAAGSVGIRALDFTTGDGGTTLSNGQLQISASTFINLGFPPNGTIKFCLDCTIANPCAGAGFGAIAKRLNNAWVCN